MRYRLRMVEFVGVEPFVQGHGMTWPDVDIDVADRERIIAVEAGTRSGSFDSLLPTVRVWLMTPVDEIPDE